MTSPDIITLQAGGDNYTYLVVTGTRALAVDATEAAPVLHTLAARNLTLTTVLSTHHHGDHTGGNLKLAQQTGCRIAGTDHRVRGCTELLSDNQTVEYNGLTLTCMLLPGHTKSSCAFYFRDAGILFTGDTLFYAGCGRLFEGDAQEMYDSLMRIAVLPPATRIFAGHEYTLDNLSFAAAVEPDNRTINERRQKVGATLQTQGYYGPSTLAEEIATNPFLRTGSTDIRSTLSMPDADDSAVFAALRTRKNHF